MGKVVKSKSSKSKVGDKVVQPEELQWKAVDIPDNLESYEGLYGLEEIDGVDVQIINGKAQFKIKDDSKTKKIFDADGDPQDTVFQDVSDDLDEEEFTGFDDDNNVEGIEANVLTENVFAKVKLPDDNVHLPHWEPLHLNSYTLTGLNGLQFKSPTLIQKKTLPLAIDGKDVIGKASTGSGKTLAYSIPILEKYISKIEELEINQKNKIINSPIGVIFVPTRELAHQVVDHLNNICKYFPIHSNSIVSITGGLSIQKQERLLNYGPSIIVATPGRCLELLEKSEAITKRLSSTDILVLDEADRLLQDGHFEEFERILELFRKNRPKGLDNYKWQTLVFSATFSKELFTKLDRNVKTNSNDEILKLLNDKLQFRDKTPAVIDVNPKELVSGQITEALVECGATERDLYLYYFLLMYKGTTLVFANSIDSVKRLAPFLNNLNIPAFAIHSSMIQKQRLRSIEQFTKASNNNEIAVLVASDVAARGLDIPNIDHVAHYHLPRSADIYIHRSGRTARAKNEGVSVMFCSPQESSGPLRKLRNLVTKKNQNHFNMHNDVKLLPIEMDLVNQLKPRVELAVKLAEASIASTSTNKEDNWIKQVADDLGIEDIDDLDDFEDDIIKKQRKRKEKKYLTKDEARSLRFDLKQQLQQPIRKLTRRSYLTSGLQNLAHIMVTGNTHEDVLGHENVNALQELKGKNIVKATKHKKPRKVHKARNKTKSSN